jgi:predicted RNA binding protein YcfA (HicA-like mRNA interferase family)
MPRRPVLKPREVVLALERLGFVEVRQRGAHRQFRHSDGRGTTVLSIQAEASRRRSCGR